MLTFTSQYLSIYYIANENTVSFCMKTNKMNKIDVCRVCLASLSEKYMSLFEKYKSFPIFEYINTLTSIDINECDGLPDKICQTCFFELETAVIFKEKCLNSTNTLKGLKNKNTQRVDTGRYQCIEIKEEIKVEDDQLGLEDYFDSLESYGGKKLLNDHTLVDKDGQNFCDISFVASQVECHDCGEIFKSKCKLRVHWKRVHMASFLICCICKKTFKSYKAMNAHTKRKILSCTFATNPNVIIEGVGQTRIFYCKECKYKTRRTKDMATHLRTHNGERPYHCNICQGTYTQLSSLQTHKETAHKSYLVEITCQYCGKCVKGRNKVYRHLKTHTEKKTKCDVCMKQVVERNMRIHMRRHTGVKSFTCEKCAATFYSSAELCNHRRWVHKKGNYFKCDLCDYKALKNHLIKKHKVKHTDENIPCTVCGMFFLTPQKLAAHQRRHFEEKKFACPQCDRKFLHRDSVRKHMIGKHFSTTIDDKPVIVKTETGTKQYDSINLDKSSPVL